MSSGYISQDNRTYTPSAVGPPRLVGEVRTIQWNGEDEPKQNRYKTGQQVVQPPRLIVKAKRVITRSFRKVTVYRVVKKRVKPDPIFIPNGEVVPGSIRSFTKDGFKIKTKPVSFNRRYFDKKPSPSRKGGSRYGRFYRPPSVISYVTVASVRIKRHKSIHYVNVTKELKPRKVYARLPKRGRSRGEHTYSKTWDVVHTAVINWYYTGYGHYSDASNSLCSFSPIYNWTSNDDLALYGKLREKVAGSDFNAGVALAELPQSLALIADAAIRIRKGLNALKRGNLPEAIKQLAGHKRARKIPKGTTVSNSKTVQSNWLELQYGWRPLLQDVYGGAELLSHHLSVPIQQVLRVSKQAKGYLDRGSSYVVPASSEVLTKKRLKAIISERDVPQLIGLTDPLSVIWEKVPYSFVVDWFIPIGNYLSARGLSQALKGTFVLSTLNTSKGSGAVFSGIDATVDSLSGPLDWTKGNLSRTVSSTLQIPLPSFKPLMKVASWQHCANAIALLTVRSAQKP